MVKVIVQVSTGLTEKEQNLIHEFAEIRGEKVAPPDKRTFGKVKDAFSYRV